LDAFLARRIGALTRSAWKRRIEDAHVAVDGRPVEKAGFALKAGMVVETDLPAPEASELAGEAIPLDVLSKTTISPSWSSPPASSCTPGTAPARERSCTP
jgi:ribosomal protein S4